MTKRDEFEKWAKEKGLPLDTAGDRQYGSFDDPCTYWAWDAWQCRQQEIDLLVCRLDFLRELAPADFALPEDKEIIAARDKAMTGRGVRSYQEAMRLVGAKRSKGALVDLVNWLLVENERLKLPAEITRRLLGRIVDEVFDGAIEDPTVIEDIYRVIAADQSERRLEIANKT